MYNVVSLDITVFFYINSCLTIAPTIRRERGMRQFSIYVAIATLILIAVVGVDAAVAGASVTIHTDDVIYAAGDAMEVSLSASNPDGAISVDVFVGLVTSSWEVFTLGPSGWSASIEPWIAGISLPAGFIMRPTTFWWIDIPSSMPPISEGNEYNLAAVLTHPGTFDWVSNLSITPFAVVTEPPREITMVPIPAGSFLMGSPDDELGRNPENEGPQRQVNVSFFLMSETEVTQQQWYDVMGFWVSCQWIGPDQPLERITWFDCLDFCNRLSDIDGHQDCYVLTDVVRDIFGHIVLANVTCDFDADGYRLPTEAEWEYACRAETTTRFYTGNHDSDLGRVGWFGDNSDNRHHTVGQKTPNAWGLYDMHGNVLEFCWDWYSFDYYRTRPSPDSDPTGPSSGELRVIRGGSWYDNGDYCRSASRWRVNPGLQGSTPFTGFRLVRSAR